MSRRIGAYMRRHHLALLALFVALGGTSYAAVRVPANSVGPKQLEANAVTSAKVRDHSLLARDFAADSLPAGPAGATGDAGPQGPKGDPGPKGDTGPQGNPGPSAVTTNFSASGTISGTNVELLPIGCCLAPGGALILSNLVLTNQNAAATSVTCRLIGARDIDTATVGLGPAGDATATQTLTLAGPDLGGGAIDLICTGSGVSYADADILTLKVGQLT
jgi:hypothetical protein